MLSLEDFDISEQGCFLSKSANKKWIKLYEEYMDTEVTRLDNVTPRKWIQREVQSFYGVSSSNRGYIYLKHDCEKYIFNNDGLIHIFVCAISPFSICNYI